VTARRFFVLLVAALAVITFAFWLSTQRYLPRDAAFGTRALPELEPALDDVTGLRIVGPGGTALVTLERTDGRWQVAERGYPADAARVRGLLRALAQLEIVEPKTADAANYPRLGVEDVATPAARGFRIELRGLEPPLALIVGREAQPGSGYVRRADAAGALLVRPRIDVDRDPRAWLARPVVDVAAARVQAFEIARAGDRPWRGERLARAATTFTLAGLPPGREPYAPDAADAVAGALAQLDFDDVRPADPGADGTAADARATFRTFDGLVVTVLGRVDGDARWLRFEAASDPALPARFPPGAGDEAPGGEQVRAGAERLAATTRGWWYRVGADRYDRTFPPLDALLRP
jgi:hypothetical protein